jgi:hypothetical protein
VQAGAGDVEFNGDIQEVLPGIQHLDCRWAGQAEGGGRGPQHGGVGVLAELVEPVQPWFGCLRA